MADPDINALFNALQLDLNATEEHDNCSDPPEPPKKLSNDTRTALARHTIKGRKMQQMLLATDAEAGVLMNPPQKTAASNMTDQHLLSRWGYIQDQDEAIYFSEDALSTLQTVPFGDVKAYVSVAHINRNEFEIDGILYPPISAGRDYSTQDEALFCQTMNPDTGVIVACDNLSPTAVLQDEQQLERIRLRGAKATTDDQKEEQEGTLWSPLPDLKFWSDVAYLQWLSVSTTPKKLTCVLRHRVCNEDLELVMNAINIKNETKNQPWPGRVYEAGTDDYHAILGTPNGASTAFLLVQHKGALGHKTIDKIRVFQGEHEALFSIAFHVRDVGAEDSDDGGSETTDVETKVDENKKGMDC